MENHEIPNYYPDWADLREDHFEYEDRQEVLRSIGRVMDDESETEENE